MAHAVYRQTVVNTDPEHGGTIPRLNPTKSVGGVLYDEAKLGSLPSSVHR